MGSHAYDEMMAARSTPGAPSPTSPDYSWSGPEGPATQPIPGQHDYSPGRDPEPAPQVDEPAQPPREPDWDDHFGHLREGDTTDREALERAIGQSYGGRREVVHRTDNDLLYRQDDRPPSQIFDGSTPGFTGRGRKVDLWQHLEDVRGGMVATTRDFDHAISRVRGSGVSYVYEIDAPGGVDVPKMDLGEPREAEVAFAKNLDVRYIKRAFEIDSTGQISGIIQNPHYYGNQGR